jgi:uncharacterized membrane protein
MAFCQSCGAPVEGRFCAKCGAAAPSQGGAPPAPAGTLPPVAAAMQDNVASALCYVLGLITGIIFLVMEPYSRNRAIRFHAFQSIFLNVAVIAVDMVIGIFFRVVFYTFGLAGLLAGILWPLFGLACFALWLYLIFSAYQGKTVLLPLIGPLAQKQAQG